MFSRDSATTGHQRMGFNNNGTSWHISREIQQPPDATVLVHSRSISIKHLMCQGAAPGVLCKTQSMIRVPITKRTKQKLATAILHRSTDLHRAIQNRATRTKFLRKQGRVKNIPGVFSILLLTEKVQYLVFGKSDIFNRYRIQHEKKQDAQKKTKKKKRGQTAKNEIT